MKRKIGIAITGLGMIVSVLVLFIGLQYLTGPSYRLVIPTETSLFLEEGVYTVYHEYNTVIDGVYYGDSDIRGLTLKVTGDEKIPMLPARSSNTYQKQGQTGKSIFSFKIDTSDNYEIVGDFKERAVLVINQMSIFDFLMYLTASAIILLLTVTFGIYMIVKNK